MTRLKAVPGLFGRNLPEGLKPLRLFQDAEARPWAIADVPAGDARRLMIFGTGEPYGFLRPDFPYESVEPIGFVDGRPVVLVRGKREYECQDAAPIDAIFVGRDARWNRRAMISPFMTPDGRIGWIDVLATYPDDYALISSGDRICAVESPYARIVPTQDGRFVGLLGGMTRGSNQRAFDAWIIDPRNRNGRGFETVLQEGPIDDALVDDDGNVVTYAFPPPRTVRHDLSHPTCGPTSASPWEFVRDATPLDDTGRRAFVGRVPGSGQETWYVDCRPVSDPFEAVGPLTKGDDGIWFFRAMDENRTFVVTLDD